jgi:Uma2 family endonuclease
MAEPAVVPATAPPRWVTDNIIVLDGVTWADYQRLLEIRGERPVPRLAYLEGVLELMTPSRPHESIKSMIGRLVEAWCLEKGVAISPYGSWLLEDKEAERAVEPDECYVLGDAESPARPDLAIEVVWSHGGIDKLDIYRRLGVREVWVWQAGTLAIFSLQGKTYSRIEQSAVLPGLDHTALLRFIDVKPMTRAVTEYRALLRASR